MSKKGKNFFIEAIKNGLWCLVLLVTITPNIVSAQSLGFSGGSSTMNVNQAYTLTITTSNNTSGLLINLLTLDEQKANIISWVNVSPFSQQCTTAGSAGTCSFTLTPTQVGSFNLSATVLGGGYQPAVTGSPIVVTNAVTKSLTISANPQTLGTGQNSIITVRTSDNSSGVLITFGGTTSLLSSFQIGSGATCTTVAGGACSVTFNSPSSGTFTINALAQNYSGAGLQMTVANSASPTPTPTPTPTSPSPTSPTSNYELLIPLPDPNNPGTNLTSVQVDGAGALGGYLNIIIKLIIGLSAVLAMLMIIWGGMQYITSELPGVKGEGKKKIMDAVVGLLVALGAWLILNTINPSLLNTNVNVAPVTIAYTGAPESSAPFSSANITGLQALGILCPGSGGTSLLSSIAQSFIGKVTYSMTARSTMNSSTVFEDCSSFIAQVFTCAGLGIPGNNTREIFGSRFAVPITNITTTVNGSTANGIPILVGDLLGWVAGGGEQYGHVMMYIGLGGNVIDAQRSGVDIRPLSSMQSRIKFIRRTGGANQSTGSSGTW